MAPPIVRAWLGVAWLLSACGVSPATSIPETPDAASRVRPLLHTSTPPGTTARTPGERTPAPIPGTPQQSATPAHEEEWTLSPISKRPLTITIVYDNNAYAPKLATDWGFAAIIAYGSHTLLFDTGGQGAILLSNMDALGIDPWDVEHVVLSHAHGDHSGGLHDLLAIGTQPVVHLPPSFTDTFKEEVAAQTTIVETAPGAQVMEGPFVTGEVSGDVPEQALVLETGRGLVVITGCAHPGVDRMAMRARELFDDQIYLVLGGFHLRDSSAGEIARILGALRQMGVEKVAPCHCTGDRAMALFSEEYGDDYIQAGAGRVVVVKPHPH